MTDRFPGAMVSPEGQTYYFSPEVLVKSWISHGLCLLFLLASPIFADPYAPGEITAPRTLVEKWEEGCGKDDGDSCYNLGVHHAQTLRNEEGSLPFYRKACSRGCGLGCFNLGGILIKSSSTREEGIASFRKSCEMSLDEKLPEEERKPLRISCRLADMVKQRENEAYSDIIESLLNSLPPHRGPGWVAFSGLRAGTTAQARETRESFLADFGLKPDDCYALYYGIGRAGDPEAAYQCFLKEKDDIQGLADIHAAYMLGHGNGVKKDLDKAIRSLESESELGRYEERMLDHFKKMKEGGENCDGGDFCGEFVEQIEHFPVAVHEAFFCAAVAAAPRALQAFESLRANLDEQGQVVLDRLQKAWRLYAQAEINLSADQYRGGSAAGMVAARTRRDLWAEYTELLDTKIMSDSWHLDPRTDELMKEKLDNQEREMKRFLMRTLRKADPERRKLLSEVARTWTPYRDAVAALCAKAQHSHRQPGSTVLEVTVELNIPRLVTLLHSSLEP